MSQVLCPDSQQSVVTFQAAAEACIKSKQAGWRNDLWTASLVKHVYPVIGSNAVSDIGTDNVLAVLPPIWTTQPETAIKVRSRVESVLSFARTRGWRVGDNPAAWQRNLEKRWKARNCSGTLTSYSPAGRGAWQPIRSSSTFNV